MRFRRDSADRHGIAYVGCWLDGGHDGPTTPHPRIVVMLRVTNQCQSCCSRPRASTRRGKHGPLAERREFVRRGWEGRVSGQGWPPPL